MADVRSWAVAVDAESPEELAAAIVADLRADRGSRTVGTATLPALTNGDALALLASIRAAAQRYGVPAPFWPEGWYSALGYEQAGDKFKLDRAHVDAAAPDAVVEATIGALTDLVAELVTRGLGDDLELGIDTRPARIRHYANVAWDQLQRDRRGIKLPPVPVAPGLPPIQPPPIPAPDPGALLPRRPQLGGSALILLAALALLILGKKG